MSCACGIKHGDKWHRRRGEPVCAEARDYHNARRRMTRVARPAGPRPPDVADMPEAPWIRGTSLYVPELDPL